MAIPTITYPIAADTNTTLFNVKDSLNLFLAKDYNPGDTRIYVEQDATKMALYPTSGIITLTEQCSEPEYRAVSFHYATKNTTEFYFTDLTLLPETPNSQKRAVVTNVTMNVVAQHHNNLKDAIIATETYIGKKSDRITRPFQGNIVQRTEYLLSVVFYPRAWFSSDKIIGLAPLSVNFTSLSFQLGEELPNNTVTYAWDFGDNTGSNQSEFPYTTSSKSISHTFQEPGLYTIKLKVTNKYGSDIVTFPAMINARYQAPDEATIEYILQAGQTYFPTENYLKTPAGLAVYLYIPSGINPITGNGYNGEIYESGTAVDPILEYTWSLADDLNHGNSTSTNALYSAGGLYDVILRTDTRGEAYRITTLENFINVVERKNLWLMTISGSNVYGNEMGLLSETFKTTQNNYFTISRNDSFLTGKTNSDQLLREFYRNVNFTQKAATSSGLGGQAVLHYASGRYSSDSAAFENINAKYFSAFAETYSFYPSYTGRPWNWTSFNYSGHTYFVLGNAVSQPSGTSPTNTQLLDNNLQDETYTVLKNYATSDFTSGANLLTYNAAEYNALGQPVYGNFSAYRTCLRGRNAYIIKNNTVGTGFQIKAFFESTENTSYMINSFSRKADIIGPAKKEGILLNLSGGIYFFNNTGSISAYNTGTESWSVGGPGYNSVAFQELQDTSVQDYEDETNTLVGTTDGANTAYLSYDYSAKAFLKFNEVDLSFSLLSPRPSGTQWSIGCY